MQEFIDLVANRPDFWMSMIVILFILGMGVFFVIYFIRNIRHDVPQPERRPAPSEASARES